MLPFSQQRCFCSPSKCFRPAALATGTLLLVEAQEHHMSYTSAESIFATTPGAMLNEIMLLDLNGDARLDLVLAFQLLPKIDQTIPIQVLMGNGEGRFSSTPASLISGGLPATVTARGHVIADFNGDGHLDLFVADTGYDAGTYPGFHNSLVLSGPSGYVNASDSLPSTLGYTHSTAAADIDGDGDMDIYVGNMLEPTAPYFLINDGTGHFSAENRSPSSSVLASGNYASATFLDANGDGHPDLFLGTTGDSAWDQADQGSALPSRLMINDGSGHFSDGGLELPSFGLHNGVVDATILDLNGDGRSDLILSVELNDYASGGEIRLLVNNGNGFTDETQARLGTDGKVSDQTWVYRVLTGDVNGDGSPDIVVSMGGGDASVYLNDADGHFTRVTGLLPGLSIYDKLAVADLNGDGMLDFVAQHPVDGARTQEAIDVFLSRPNAPMQNGGDGDDPLIGNGTAANVLHGMLGNDTVIGGAGQDYLRGEEGNDVISGGAAFDDVEGNQGNDTEHGGAGDDWVVGGKDQDLLFGDAGWDIVYGNLGDDTCEGGDGADWVRGGQGNDLVVGGAGDDLLWGDRGSDTLTGGAGADVFHTFAGAGLDRVTDFNAAEGDRISFDGPVTYTVHVEGQDTVIDLGGGDQMILVGVTGFSPAWFA